MYGKEYSEFANGLKRHGGNQSSPCEQKLPEKTPINGSHTSSHLLGRLDAPDGDGPLAVQALGIPLVALLLAVLEPLALVVL